MDKTFSEILQMKILLSAVLVLSGLKVHEDILSDFVSVFFLFFFFLLYQSLK